MASSSGCSLQSLLQAFSQQRDAIQAQLAVRARLQQELESVSQQVVAVTTDLRAHEEAAIVLQQVAQSQQRELQEKLEKIVSYALTVIFGRRYVFKISFEQRGQQSEVFFRVMDEWGVLQDLKSAHGGGLLVVTAFLLRVIVLLSVQPAQRRVLLLDEPFIQISAEYRDTFANFLRQFAKSADVQIVMVTHESELAAIGDKGYRFRLVNGVTQVEVID